MNEDVEVGEQQREVSVWLVRRAYLAVFKVLLLSLPGFMLSH